MNAARHLPKQSKQKKTDIYCDAARDIQDARTRNLANKIALDREFHVWEGDAEPVKIAWSRTEWADIQRATHEEQLKERAQLRKQQKLAAEHVVKKASTHVETTYTCPRQFDELTAAAVSGIEEKKKRKLLKKQQKRLRQMKRLVVVR